MTEILLILLIVLFLINLLLSFRAYKKADVYKFDEIKNYFDNLNKTLLSIENSLKDEFSRNRDEFNKNSKYAREEINNSFKILGESVLKTMADISNLQKNQLETFSTQLTALTKSNEEKFEKFTKIIEDKLNYSQQQINFNTKENRDEISKSLKSFEEKFNENVKNFNDLQKQKFDSLIQNQTEINKTTELKLEKMRETVENQLKVLQEENTKKLDEMRATVDEKLQSTLEKRLTESFKQVSDRLEQVHKGLGEMQTLAIGVGDLKKVLSNVKTRGILGEIQLGNILEQILTPEQYERNVKTKKDSQDNVEFAIKLPGKDDSGQVVYLPLDAKFPLEKYHSLIEAYEIGTTDLVENAAKELENSIKKCARDIRDKYIDPPNTTDFGVMFLPVEGLYAEVVRRTGLIEILQRDYKVIITGPTTLAAILNSLQMGFRTLAIEKRASEVWKVLGAIKTEFGKFGDVLKKAQEKIVKASEDIDELVGTRTKKIQSKLKNIQEIPTQEATLILTDGTVETEQETPSEAKP